MFPTLRTVFERAWASGYPLGGGDMWFSPTML